MVVWFEPHERMDEAIARKYNDNRVIARARQRDEAIEGRRCNPMILNCFVAIARRKTGVFRSPMVRNDEGRDFQIGLRFALHVPRRPLAKNLAQILAQSGILSPSFSYVQNLTRASQTDRLRENRLRHSGASPRQDHFLFESAVTY
jgi:hypothetical protein